MYLSVTNNFLDPLLIENLKYNFLYEIPHIWGHSSNKGNNEFYFASLSAERPDIRFIHAKINNEILKLNTKIDRVYFNIQHNSMDGDFHMDDGDLTALLMITDTPNDGGGRFEYEGEDNKINFENFEQNKLIIFQGIRHRGCAPTNNKPRITLAFKLNFIKNKYELHKNI